MSPMIANAEEVTKYFGYWPEFCDARLQSFSYELPGVIELSVLYTDVDLQKSARVGLRFIGATEMELKEFRSENVIDEIKIETGSPFVVNINSAFGLWGQFCCTEITVAYVRA